MSRSDADHGVDPPLELILDRADLGVVVFDNRGTIRYHNGSARFLLALADEATEFPFPDVVLERSDTGTCEINAIAEDGSVRFVELQSGRIAWEGAEFRLVTLKDVTAYHERATESEREVAARDDFIAILSHELRNPLSAVTAGFDVLQTAREDKTTFAEVSRVIADQLRQLRRLLDDLLDVGRISREQLNLSRKPIDLREVVRRGIAALTESVTTRDHRLSVALPEEIVSVNGDAERLQQVVVNLLGNAIKYTPPGGDIRLQLTIDPDTEGTDNRSKAVLTVIDTGCGIEPEFLGQMFDRFAQGRQRAQGSIEGFGLGLALADAIVHQHSGQITASSAGIDRGTELRVVLPMIEAESLGSSRMEPETTLQPLRILLIEDQNALRILTARALEGRGHRVETAPDGETGLRRLRTESFELALIDIGLPGLSGYDVMQQISAPLGDEGDTANIPMNLSCKFVALTGYGRPDDRSRASEAGFDAHLTKPFDIRSFTNLLHELFGHKG